VPTQNNKKMTYVRLGNSGLKVSRIILGLMSYGNKEWMDWVLDEREGIKHVKAALRASYDARIQTFDTANVYSDGESERIIGKAIKQLNLPRDEIVVMTNINKLDSTLEGFQSPQSPQSGWTYSGSLSQSIQKSSRVKSSLLMKLFAIVGRTPSEAYMGDTSQGDANRYVNQYGLS
ncbi:hypothetical protein FRC11_003684, partial [Ceratobasidium sp. 423]